MNISALFSRLNLDARRNVDEQLLVEQFSCGRSVGTCD